MCTPLKIDITSLLANPKQTISVKGRREASEFSLDDESFHIKHPLDVDFQLQNDADVIVAEGSYRGTLTCLCGRCLNPYETDLESEFRARFFTTAQELRREKKEEDDPVYRELIEEGKIDLGFVICQDILIQCPMRPLCKEDCKGLCPECGANLNEEDCGHEVEAKDPRLSKFRELAEEMEETD